MGDSKKKIVNLRSVTRAYTPDSLEKKLRNFDEKIKRQDKSIHDRVNNILKNKKNRE
ncbi:hypothetical protein ABHN05_11350 [Brevibacillus laterosporus]|uniref:hypothetical protein n=1 Tax=Brevibacillus laterosporus TaxID=1465 RepID=UPI00138727DB|nr:hypothetical protein [Brevibacillus laterosporus]MED1786630.1 hypothetical protein [Brevibacillus laterosporus]MED4766137.1 hypothetical protein [Brevibacillus laterosporus]